MDIFDWAARVFGAIFCLLLAWRTIVRIMPAHIRETPPVVMWSMLISGIGWLALVAFDLAFPIETSVYVTNGSPTTSYEVKVGSDAFCLPSNAYQLLTWRTAMPEQITAGPTGEGNRTRYPIGKGTWFVNVSPVPISADLIDNASATADWAGFGVNTQGSQRFSVRGSTPYKLFSNSDPDKVAAFGTLMTERRLDAPCPKAG